jgi:hypothetical protein
MRSGVIIAALTGTALLLFAGQASAQTVQNSRARQPVVSLSEAQTAQQGAARTPPPARRGMRWYDSGRWGLDLNMNQPVGREAEWGDVQAGAYYRVNPRLRVGASAGLGSPEADPARAPETDRRAQPRVRLESIFRF